jgi:hypothetical protein
MTKRIILAISVLLMVSSVNAQFAMHTTHQSSIITYHSGVSCNSMTSQSLHSGTDHMATGSRYTSDVPEVGAATPTPMYNDNFDGPATAPGGPRRAAPGEDEEGYDPDNIQFGDLADGTWFLLLLAALSAAVVSLRRQRALSVQLTQSSLPD